MTDRQLLKLYDVDLNEATIMLQNQYYGLCYSVAYRILQNHEDAQECVNDVLFRCSTKFLEEKPRSIQAYLRVVTRNQAMDRYRQRCSLRRGGGESGSVYEEGCLGTDPTEDICDQMVLGECLRGYLGSRRPEERQLFLRRYRDQRKIGELSEEFLLSESCIKLRLMRMRRGLRESLEENGVEV